jgi:hypothetical protein
VVVKANSKEDAARVEVATLLVSPEPLTSADLDRLEAVVSGLGFDVVLTPRTAVDSTWAALAAGDDAATVARLPADVTPPTDDKPFFFHTLRLDRISSVRGLAQADARSLRAVYLLATLLAVVLGLSLLCLGLPLLLTRRRIPRAGAGPWFVYFAAIGLGFLFVEIAQTQRLNLFLGHPTYSLSAVLFSLLVSAGAGSALASGRVRPDARAARLCLGLLVVALCCLGFLQRGALAPFQASGVVTRLAVATALLIPAGTLMGMALPIGLSWTSRSHPLLGPWFWSLNGAASVCASVLTVIVSLQAGIAASLWVGTAAYAVAFLAFVFATRR